MRKKYSCCFNTTVLHMSSKELRVAFVTDLVVVALLYK